MGKIYMSSSDRLCLYISTPVGISYQTDLLRFVLTQGCSLLTVENAAGIFDPAVLSDLFNQACRLADLT